MNGEIKVKMVKTIPPRKSTVERDKHLSLTFGFDEEEVEEEVWDEDESPHDPLCSTLHFSPEYCDCGRVTREA